MSSEFEILFSRSITSLNLIEISFKTYSFLESRKLVVRFWLHWRLPEGIHFHRRGLKKCFLQFQTLLLIWVTEVRSKILTPLETTWGNSFSPEGLKKCFLQFQTLHFTGGIQIFFQGVYNFTGGIQIFFQGVYNSTGGIQIFFQGVYNSTGGIQITFQGVYNSAGGIQISFQGIYNSAGGIQISI